MTPVIGRKITHAEIAAMRARLLLAQKNKCPLCGGGMGASKALKNPALDHDHTTGVIRDVLCVNCNGMEGKALGIAKRGGGANGYIEWVRNLLAYWERHQTPAHGPLLHPTHKTEAEKRLRANELARKRRAAAKAK